jgi:hypothetical protein
MVQVALIQMPYAMTSFKRFSGVIHGGEENGASILAY